jgi:uncharacterized protein (DUF2336 family)
MDARVDKRTDGDGGARGDARGGALIEYEEQKRRARDPDPGVRAALAADPGTRPEVLYFLAEDADPEVRRIVARNENTPRHADLLLSKDTDAEIRGDLADKIARLTPELPDDKRSTLYDLTVQALEVLAEDQIVRVREILAVALKDVANAPPGVIRTLARDTTLTVSSPILEFSPVLSDADLLEIIRSAPVQGAMNAIARRRALTETLSEAIVAAGDDDVVTELLRNPSAQIREDTLDYIIDRAPSKVAWHEPLTMRPSLSPRAVQRMATFVAMNLLDRMQKRLDLDDDTVVALAQAVESRLATDSKKTLAEDAFAGDDELESRIERMHKAGGLTTDVMEKALSRGDRRFVVAALAKLSGVAADVIGRIVSHRSAKGLISITWKAGLRPHFAGRLQAQLAGLGPKESISVPADRWPMTPDAMQWQIDFHKDLGED